MIREAHGDILTADVEALVNPVNTVGVMGAGLGSPWTTTPVQVGTGLLGELAGIPGIEVLAS